MRGLVLLAFVAACGCGGSSNNTNSTTNPDGGGQTNRGDAGTESDSQTPNNTPTGPDLLDNPGEEGSASYWAARVLAECRATWQSDARIVEIVGTVLQNNYVWSVTTLSASDLENYCVGGDYNGEFNRVDPIAQYAPGWVVDPAIDEFNGWLVDRPAVLADFGLTDQSYFRVNPAKHTRQVGFDSELEGFADDAAVILAFESASGEKWLIDGRTGVRLNE